MAEPVTPPRGFRAVPDEEEFHLLSMLTEDTTEVTCEQCGPLEHLGTGVEGIIAHSADHTMVTGHTVTERHVLTRVFRERRS
jgi:hypothetical protein